MSLRPLLLVVLAAAACAKDASSSAPGGSAAPTGNSTAPAGELKQLRIGYQKNGVLVIARQQAALEHKLAPLGVAVTWVEFTSGPPLLEALHAGSIDLGQTG